VAVIPKAGRCSEIDLKYEVNFVLEKLSREFRLVVVDRWSLFEGSR